MPAYAGAYVYKDASITIDGTEYAGQLRKVRLVPETPIQTYRTLVPDGIIQDVDSTSWTLELIGLQSMAVSGTGLSDVFNAATPGTQMDIVLKPKVGTNLRTATFTMLAMPVEFGGEQGAHLTFEASFPVVGSVTFGTS